MSDEEDIPDKLSPEQREMLMSAAKRVNEGVTEAIFDVINAYPPEAAAHVALCALAGCFTVGKMILEARGMTATQARDFIIASITVASSSGSTPLAVGEAMESVLGPNRVVAMVEADGTVLKRRVQ